MAAIEPAIFIQIEENPNCAAMDGQVFQPRSTPGAIRQVRILHDGVEEWCDITGVDGAGKTTVATACLIDDSGEGSCYLVVGGAWGLRLKSTASEAQWNLNDATQWGECYLLLPAHGGDLPFR